MKALAEDEVLAIAALYAGEESVAKLAKSHEALRYELERLGTGVDVAVRALSSLRKPR